MITTKTVDEVRRDVNASADMGVDIIKFRLMGNANDIPPDAYGAIIDQAHKRGLMAAAHMSYTNDAWGLLKAGVDVFAHSVRDKDIDATLIAEMKRRNVGYIATLTRDLSVFVYETTPTFFSDPFFLRHVAEYRPQMTQVSDPAFQAKTRASKEAQVIKVALEQASRNVKIVADAGIPVAMGTDSGAPTGRWQGYFEHVEMELMVKAGLTPMQTLVAATRRGRARDEARQPARHASARKVGGLSGPECRSTGGYPEHAADRLRMDCRSPTEEREPVGRRARVFVRRAGLAKQTRRLGGKTL